MSPKRGAGAPSSPAPGDASPWGFRFPPRRFLPQRLNRRADMNPKSCLGCTRSFLFLFNVFCFALGSLLLAFGLWVLFDRQSFAATLGSPVSGLRIWTYVLAGGGTVMMVLGFLGGLGALRGVRALLLLYFGVLLLLFAAQITLGVVVYTQRVRLAAAVATYVQELIRGYPLGGPLGAPQETWDAVQQQLRCCGWNGPQDWNRPGGDSGGHNGGGIACSCLPPRNVTHGAPPALPHGRCPTAAPPDAFSRGCAGGVQVWLAENLVTLVGASVGIGLVELLLLMVSMFLVRNLDPDYEKLLRGL